jgi:hypothetical protein
MVAMQLLIVTAWIVCGAIAVVVAPWIILGMAVVYFRLFRRENGLAWFDWPWFLARLIVGAVITS